MCMISHIRGRRGNESRDAALFLCFVFGRESYHAKVS